MKTLIVSSFALMALATASLAAPQPNAVSPLSNTDSLVVPVNANEPPNSGKVTEVIPAGSYTYLHVENDGRGRWLAIPRRDVPVGAEIRYGEGAVMKAFHSTALNRNFDEVLFLGGIVMEGDKAGGVPPGHPPVPAARAPEVPAGHPPTPADKGANVPAGHPPMPVAPENLPNVGTVKESIAAGSYTYLHVARNNKEEWLAIPRHDVPVGAEIRYAEGMVMRDFYSRSLNRTFKQVLFVEGVTVTGQ